MRELIAQLVLVGGAVLLYFAVRGITQGSEAAAVDHGLDLLAFEKSIGMNTEARLQTSILDNRNILTAINWIYIWGHWPVITATLLWLHRANRPQYVLLRNAMFASGAIGLVIFTLYPVAPPRLIDIGMTDTVTSLSNSYRILQPPSLVNKYAALPSLHVGWNLLVGAFIWRNAKTRIIRAQGAASPALMIAAVVLTANHYIVDAAAGAVVALTGLWMAYKAKTIFTPDDHRDDLPATFLSGGEHVN